MDIVETVTFLLAEMMYLHFGAAFLSADITYFCTDVDSILLYTTFMSRLAFFNLALRESTPLSCPFKSSSLDLLWFSKMTPALGSWLQEASQSQH